LQEPSHPVEEYIHTSPANILKKNLIPEFPNAPKNSRSNNVQNTMSFSLSQNCPITAKSIPTMVPTASEMTFQHCLATTHSKNK